MNRENLKDIARLVNETIDKKLNEGDYTGYLAGNNLRDRFNKVLIDAGFIETEDFFISVNSIGNITIDVYKTGPNYNPRKVEDAFKKAGYIIKLKPGRYGEYSSNDTSKTESENLTESTIEPFQNKREAMFAVDAVVEDEITQKSFINRLAASKRAGTIDDKNFKLLLGDLRETARYRKFKLEPIIDRLIDKYHSGSDVFNPNLKESANPNNLKIGDIVGNTVEGFNFKVIELNSDLHGLKVKNIKTGEIFNTTYENMKRPMQESRLDENPLQPAPPAPAQQRAPAPTPPAPVEQGVDPAWKLDMIDFIGNSFQGQAKQFLYQAKKSNPKATPEQITAMVNDLITSNQIVELFKTRFLSSIRAAL